MSDAMQVFDRQILRRRRDRAARGLEAHDFLFREIGERLGDRLLDIARQFPLALDLGSRTGNYGPAAGGTNGIETVVRCDLSPAMVERGPRPAVVADDEWLPFAGGCFDLVYSNLDLHWVNDLPGTLMQIAHALKPDGLFLAAMLGGGTLMELRDALMAAELEISGGASPRVSPFAEMRDAGALLQRAGFALPVIDSDIITATYDNVFRLMADLRGMGETNAVLARLATPSRRAVFMRAAEIYDERYRTDDGRIHATFEIIYLHGWAPHETQPRPLRPGSAATRLADALGATELPAGDKAGPC